MYEHRIRLAERRQHPPDVVQERLVGTDHQHAVALEARPLGVEQVGHAVQRHHGLARSRAAFDHQHPGVVEPDDLVLLGLDGGYDVAHPVTAGRVDRRQQRGVAVPAAVDGIRAAQHLVGEVDQETSPGVELPAAAHALGVRGGGDVERPRRGGAPVEQQRIVVGALVEDAEPADVEPLTGDGVETPEAQSVVGHLQALLLFGQRTYLDIAFQQGGALPVVPGPAQRGAVAVLEPRALAVQPGVELGDIALLGLQFVFELVV